MGFMTCEGKRKRLRLCLRLAYGCSLLCWAPLFYWMSGLQLNGVVAFSVVVTAAEQALAIQVFHSTLICLHGLIIHCHGMCSLIRAHQLLAYAPIDYRKNNCGWSLLGFITGEFTCRWFRRQSQVRFLQLLTWLGPVSYTHLTLPTILRV